MGLETGVIRALKEDGTASTFNHNELARLGFANTERSVRFLADDLLAFLPPEIVQAMGHVPDPDEAMISLLRLVEAAENGGEGDRVRRSVSSADDGPRVVSLLGTSVALGDYLTRHPEKLGPVMAPMPELSDWDEHVRAALLESVGADPEAEVPVADPTDEASNHLRVAYYQHLAQIAVADACAETPEDIQPEISTRLSGLAAAALESALAIARAGVDGHEQVRLAVIAMGKTGARELNYISDVDVMYVAEPASDGVDDATVTRVGSALARDLARVCSERTSEGALWQVDANLRPEGKDGELVRTLASYRRYYTKWAHSWEFQALLKARPVAGDAELGRVFRELTSPFVWKASTRDGFVDDTRAMRRRVVSLIPKAEADRNIKLGPGGLRDVEFTVQLLQMVHGRSDDAIRARGTLEALGQLTDGGYVSRKQSAEFDAAYRRMRAIEHRLQLHRLRRTQVLPTSASDLRRLARSMGEKADDFPASVNRTRLRIRQLHEEIYYRPLLATSARLSDGEISLTPEAQKGRLAAIGYRDPAKATQHIAALTKGLSRASSIQRQLLPSLLEWFADGTDPDLGLLAFRKLSEQLQSTHWFLGMLRDSGVAAKRLTRILSSSKYIGRELEQLPQSVRWLSKTDELTAVDPGVLREELAATGARSRDEHELVDAVRTMRKREILRVAMAHVTHRMEPPEVAAALSALADVIVEAALSSAQRAVEDDLGLDDLGIDVLVLALGSYGAQEMGYSSDADVQFIVRDRGAGSDAAARGIAVGTALQRIVNAPSAGIDMKVNADLRPEGRSGPLARTFESWSSYYATHAETWERQSLLRARVAVGPADFAAEATAALDAVRYPSEGLRAETARKLARMKARIEGERLPRGVKPTHHLKLGRGAMTDVEWVVQRLLIAHGHEQPDLRVQGTLAAIDELRKKELLSGRDAESLREAWALAWQLRRALFLWRGRESDSLPTDIVDLRAIAALVDGDLESARELEERYLKLTRHSRVIAEREIFGE